ncbi:MAG: hypothetical protein G8345_11445 [Magnetococcales bacterium]|nr:hypothetical protein [Magnetococcales bacterium]NGZ27488.1 hypothetical protein [Magnetococcales bacterium]
MSATSQLGIIGAMAYHTIMVEKVGQMRESSRLSEIANRATPYVSPNKPPGALTAKQEEANEDRLRVKEIISQNGKRAFHEHFPPVPSVQEMTGLQKLGAEVADRIYEQKPVKSVPFASQVAQAYRQAQSEEGLYVSQTKLSAVYS